MSSGAEAGGVVAAAVALPFAAAYGAGWLAWQGGKKLAELNRAVDRQIQETKRRQEEAERHRRMAALAAHGQMADMCAQLLDQLNAGGLGPLTGLAETEQIKYDLESIRREALPEDTDQIESVTALGYLRLDKALRRQREIAAWRLEESQSGLYRGLSVADLLDDLRLAVGAMELRAVRGQNAAAAADGDVLERAALNEAFSQATARILADIDAAEELASTYGLTTAAKTWVHSCFNGVDEQVQRLCRPTTTNRELKKGVRRLQEAAEQYEMMSESIEREARRMASLYEAYCDGAKALGEQQRSLRSFQSAGELEKALQYLQKRAEKAAQCAEIYQALGPSAYLCYAWDQELQAMGYKVHSRSEVAELAQHKPDRARLGEQKLPFYRWSDKDLTQLYAMGEHCALQVIVHEDGKVSMQSIAASDDEEAVAATQRIHCAQLSRLHRRLWENWFVCYDIRETETPEEITTAAQWREADGYAWKQERQQDQRREQREQEKKKQYIQ